jgi:MFS family permease
MRNFTAGFLVFFGGFAIMVLEIIGARFLAKDFGSSFYVWISQIGVILIALAAGYAVGGSLADKFQRASFLSFLLIPAGIYTFLIPKFTPRLLEAIIMRHPLDQDIPIIWQKLDPAIGTALIFLLPCFVLAILSPYTIRLASTKISHVGRISGLVYAFSTIGSIAGVFVSGYILIDLFRISIIISGTGAMIVILGFWSLLMDKYFINPTSQGDSVS